MVRYDGYAITHHERKTTTAKKNMNTIVIIGTSAAGIAACGKLRDLDPTARIICVTKEMVMPYNRCLLADLLSGSKSLEQVHSKKEAFFADRAIELRLGCEVIGIDTAAQQVIVKSGDTIAYTSLLVATGRSGFIPPGFDISQPGIFPFYDLADVTDILAYASTTAVKKAAVIGGGISGLECSDALLQQEIEVTLVERGPHVLPRQLDEGGAAFLQGLMTSKGMSVHCNATVEKVHKAPTHYLLTLSTGDVIEADLIVVATGGKQNVQIVHNTDIATDGYGIVVDENQRTSVANVFAAGDVCSVKDLLSGERTYSTLWPDAVSQGLTAAHSMLGLSKPYGGSLTITSTNIFGITLVTCGSFSALQGLETLHKQDATFYHRFYVQDGILRGFVMVGNVGGVGQLRKAIVEKSKIV